MFVFKVKPRQHSLTVMPRVPERLNTLAQFDFVPQTLYLGFVSQQIVSHAQTLKVSV